MIRQRVVSLEGLARARYLRAGVKELGPVDLRLKNGHKSQAMDLNVLHVTQ